MPKVRASSGMIGTMYWPRFLSRSSFWSMRTMAIVVETVRPREPSRMSWKDSGSRTYMLSAVFAHSAQPGPPRRPAARADLTRPIRRRRRPLRGNPQAPLPVSSETVVRSAKRARERRPPGRNGTGICRNRACLPISATCEQMRDRLGPGLLPKGAAFTDKNDLAVFAHASSPHVGHADQ